MLWGMRRYWSASLSGEVWLNKNETGGGGVLSQGETVEKVFLCPHSVELAHLFYWVL